jgi:glucosylceramidase
MVRFGRIAAVSGILLCALHAGAQASVSQVAEWLTSADRSALLTRQAGPIAFAAPDALDLPVIHVDAETRYQQMEGFGFALTGGSCELLMRMSPHHRHELLEELFGEADASIHVSYLRVSIGASDMNERVFTYDDLPPGETDLKLRQFSLGPDLHDVVPVLKEIVAIEPQISILASPWTAPSWMKTNGLPKGGSLKPEYNRVYAQYLVRYLRAMAARGIPIRAITMQNEPENPNNTPSMRMTAEQEATLLADDFGPALEQARLHPEVILFDHNPDHPEYPLAILANPRASRYAAGTGFHLYLGQMHTLTQVHDAYPKKDIFFTEQMVTQEDNTKPLNIAEPVSRLIIGAPRNWARNVLLWNLAADPQDKPHTDDGGCPFCQGAITLDGDLLTRNLPYYVVAQASKFVPAGSVRIASDRALDVDRRRLPPHVAFLTPGGEIVLIVANPGTDPESFSVECRGRTFRSRLAAGDAATYVWKASGSD